MSKKLTFEKAMDRLEEILSGLDQADQPLDRSLELFSEGAELIAFCNKELDQAQLKLEKLFPDGPEEYMEDGKADE